MATKKKTSKFGEKAAFVRSVSRGTPAKEVVALGKKKGLTLTENYVYTVRSSSAAATKKSGKPGPKPGRKAAPSTGMTDPEVMLRDAIADLGLVKATEILEAVKATIKGR